MRSPSDNTSLLRTSEPAQTLTESVASRIRERVISGTLTPGSHLSELTLTEELQVSRNTLREVFRLLTKEGLLRHEANRGVFVRRPACRPSSTSIACGASSNVRRLPRPLPVIRARRTCAPPSKAPSAAAMPAMVGVGSADIAFHAAIVELADSPRLSSFYAQISFELRLVFGLLQDGESCMPLRRPDLAILTELENGKPSAAAETLEAYLLRAERFILGAYARVAVDR